MSENLVESKSLPSSEEKIKHESEIAPNTSVEQKIGVAEQEVKKKSTPKKKIIPKKPKKTSSVKPSLEKKKTPEKEIVTDPTKVTTRSKSHANWSDLIYGSGEKYLEGDILAVRAPKESGEQFWLCTLDGVGTEENSTDLEITWFESKENYYVEGEEDDIPADSVICKTRLNVGSTANTWVLPQVELKSIRDTLKLEMEESSEELKNFSEEQSGDKSIKEDDEEAGNDNVSVKRVSTREPKSPMKEKTEKPKSQQGEKRKNSASASAFDSGEPKPKRAYKKREKKDPPTTTTTTETETKLSQENKNEMVFEDTNGSTPNGRVTTITETKTEVV